LSRLSGSSCGRGWGPHTEITGAGLAVLPEAKKVRDYLGDDFARLSRDYCWTGDWQEAVRPDHYADDYLLYPGSPRHVSHMHPDVRKTFAPFFRRPYFEDTQTRIRCTRRPSVTLWVAIGPPVVALLELSRPERESLPRVNRWESSCQRIVGQLTEPATLGGGCGGHLDELESRPCERSKRPGCAGSHDGSFLVGRLGSHRLPFAAGDFLVPSARNIFHVAARPSVLEARLNAHGPVARSMPWNRGRLQ